MNLFTGHILNASVIFAFLKSFLIFFFVAAVIYYIKEKSRRSSGGSSYVQKGSLLTVAEKRFYDVLSTVVSEGYVINPKVGLKDVIESVPGDRGAFARISQKHLDFVICERGSLRPLCAIELDDRSHCSPAARSRDEVKDKAMAAAGIPLIRVHARGKYNQQDIKLELLKVNPSLIS